MCGVKLEGVEGGSMEGLARNVGGAELKACQHMKTMLQIVLILGLEYFCLRKCSSA